jgi:hypothetical protein
MSDDEEKLLIGKSPTFNDVNLAGLSFFDLTQEDRSNYFKLKTLEAEAKIRESEIKIRESEAKIRESETEAKISADEAKIFSKMTPAEIIRFKEAKNNSVSFDLFFSNA